MIDQDNRAVSSRVDALPGDPRIATNSGGTLMFGRSAKKREATIEARLEALELTLLALLPVLPVERRAVVRRQMAQFAERAVTDGPPSSLVSAQHAQVYRDMLSERMQHMIELMDQGE